MSKPLKQEISFQDFNKIDIRIGTVIEVTDFPKARKPAYQLTIDFGSLGIKHSSAQITDLYSKEDLIAKKIVAIVNFKKKQIANFFSECLVLGIENSDNKIVLLKTSTQIIKNGEQVS
jgi:tRNA-binding protein